MVEVRSASAGSSSASGVVTRQRLSGLPAAVEERDGEEHAETVIAPPPISVQRAPKVAPTQPTTGAPSGVPPITTIM